MPSLRHNLHACAILVFFGAQPLLAASVSSTTPQYKCYVQTSAASTEIIRFYSLDKLPARFTDDPALARAQIPESERRRIIDVIECARQDLSFYSPTARDIERQQPQ